MTLLAVMYRDMPDKQLFYLPGYKKKLKNNENNPIYKEERMPLY